jgi:hypothetical protein
MYVVSSPCSARGEAVLIWRSSSMQSRRRSVRRGDGSFTIMSIIALIWRQTTGAGLGPPTRSKNSRRFLGTCSSTNVFNVPRSAITSARGRGDHFSAQFGERDLVLLDEGRRELQPLRKLLIGRHSLSRRSHSATVGVLVGRALPVKAVDVPKGPLAGAFGKFNRPSGGRGQGRVYRVVVVLPQNATTQPSSLLRRTDR